jgi:hypothetical protein
MGCLQKINLALGLILHFDLEVASVVNCSLYSVVILRMGGWSMVIERTSN